MQIHTAQKFSRIPLTLVLLMASQALLANNLEPKVEASSSTTAETTTEVGQANANEASSPTRDFDFDLSDDASDQRSHPARDFDFDIAP